MRFDYDRYVIFDRLCELTDNISSRIKCFLAQFIQHDVIFKLHSVVDWFSEYVMNSLLYIEDR